ncbi:MAG: family 78 glycoside hydrolase catalytic domain, partial [Bacteroidales bacterium]|nr:family 78 glycoside hydrolase catalytic domain [Bacteroidales bacterium]
MKRRSLLALLLVACQPSFEVYDLRCEGLTEPLAIDSVQPHFSWKIRSEHPMEQAAYEIEVGPDHWRSGKVVSPDQVMVPYGGLPLYSRQQAWWRVRVWDAAGKVSAWSPKRRFGIGVLDGLKGVFIGAVPGEGRQPVFRKVFTADKGGEAVLHVTSLGYHEVHFNGKKISDAVLLPAVSQLDKRSLIVTYSVNLRKGENELLIYAGSGWYKPTTFGVAYDGPLVKAELDVDGVPFLWTDDTWEGAWSGRKDLGTWEAHRFGGEWIKAGVEPEWGPVEYVAVEGIVSTPMMCRPIQIQEALEPVSVEKREDGSILVDFGRIVNAILEMTLPQVPAGTAVTATFSEFLHPDGTLETAT